MPFKLIFTVMFTFIVHITHSANPRRPLLPEDLLPLAQSFLDHGDKISTYLNVVNSGSEIGKTAKAWILENMAGLSHADLSALNRGLWKGGRGAYHPSVRTAALNKTKMFLHQQSHNCRLGVMVKKEMKCLERFIDDYFFLLRADNAHLHGDYIKLFSTHFIGLVSDFHSGHTEYLSQFVYAMNQFLWTTDREVVDRLTCTAQYQLRDSFLNATQGMINSGPLPHQFGPYPKMIDFLCAVYVQLFPANYKEQNRDYQEVFEAALDAREQSLSETMPPDGLKMALNTVAEYVNTSGIHLRFPLELTEETRQRTAVQNNDLTLTVIFDMSHLIASCDDYGPGNACFDELLNSNYGEYYERVILQALQIHQSDWEWIGRFYDSMIRTIERSAAPVRRYNVISDYVLEITRSLIQSHSVDLDFYLEVAKLSRRLRIFPGYDAMFREELTRMLDGEELNVFEQRKFLSWYLQEDIDAEEFERLVRDTVAYSATGTTA